MQVPRVGREPPQRAGRRADAAGAARPEPPEHHHLVHLQRGALQHRQRLGGRHPPPRPVPLPRPARPARRQRQPQRLDQRACRVPCAVRVVARCCFSRFFCGFLRFCGDLLWEGGVVYILIHQSVCVQLVRVRARARVRACVCLRVQL